MGRVIVVVVCLVLMGWFSNPVAQEPFQAFLPIVQQEGGELRIYDKYGAAQDWDWLVTQFGPIVVEGSSVAELHEVEGPVALIADVGSVGTPVVFYWADAPFLPAEYHNCGKVRGLIIYSNSIGRAEFAMGGGSYYFPPDIGPHWVWMKNSGCLGGMGMIGLTNHRHLDSVWR